MVAGNLEMPLRQLVNKLGLTDVVTFRRAQLQDKVQQYVREAHIFPFGPLSLQPNGLQGRHSQFAIDGSDGISGLPVVSTRHSGIPELVGRWRFPGCFAEERFGGTDRGGKWPGLISDPVLRGAEIGHERPV